MLYSVKPCRTRKNLRSTKCT